MERLYPKKKCSCCKQMKYFTEFEKRYSYYEIQENKKAYKNKCKQCVLEHPTQQHMYNYSKKILRSKQNTQIPNYEKINPHTQEYETICRAKEYVKVNSVKLRNNYLKKVYGISLNDYNIMFEDQNGCCAICGNHQLELNKNLAVDHDHITGKVRGLLCSRCNTSLGGFQDDLQILQKATDYLNKHK